MSLQAASERPSPGKQFVQHNTETENVAAAIDAMTFSARLFRRHVTRRSSKSISQADVLFVQRQTEVAQVRSPVILKKDIARLHVPMKYTPGMREVQRLRDHRDDRSGHFRCQRACPGIERAGSGLKRRSPDGESRHPEA